MILSAVTIGSLLNGHLSYKQYSDGYRSGIEPVLLAAFVPARPGDIIVEGGCGAGAGLLCLAHRVARIRGFGFECDANIVSIAKQNVIDNNFSNLHILHTKLPDMPLFLPEEREHYDHAFANPPWHGNEGPPSPNHKKNLAKRITPGLLDDWITSLTRRLRNGGTLSLSLPTSLYPQALHIMYQKGYGALTLYPLWPKLNLTPRIVLLQGRRNSSGGGIVLPGLVLHDSTGNFTPAAQSIMRDGKATGKTQRS